MPSQGHHTSNSELCRFNTDKAFREEWRQGTCPLAFEFEHKDKGDSGKQMNCW